MFLSITFSVLVTTINAEEKLCYDYAQCANDPSITSPDLDWIYCRGSQSCTGAGAAVTGDSISCSGARACANISSIHYTAGTGGAYCGALESCVDSAFNNMETVHCGGSKTCIGATITDTTTVNGYGAYSLINSTIIADNGNITVSLHGYYAGQGSTLVCNSSAVCSVICGGTACANLNIIGTGQWSVSYASNDTIRVNTENDGTMVLLNAIKDNIDCAQTFDIDRERTNGLDIVSNETGSVCCRGKESCRGIGLISLGNNTLLCSGDLSCYTYNPSINIHKIEGEHANIVCSGGSACVGSTIITEGEVQCSAHRACEESNITSSANVYCTGWQGCLNAHIYISPNSAVSIFLLGKESGVDVSIHCLSGAVCSIYCGGTEACDYISAMDCSLGHCDVYCSADAGCPVGYTMNPTMPPTNPTLEPTYIPSYDPTLSPIIFGTVYGNICSSNYSKELNTTYHIQPSTNLCINAIISVVSQLMSIIDVIYNENGYFVYSNITPPERDRLSFLENSQYCGNYTFSIITCFKPSITNEKALVNFTKSDIFIDEINNKMRPPNTSNNTVPIIKYIYITNVTVVTVVDPVFEPSDDTTKDSMLLILGTILCITVFIIIVVVRYIYKKRQRLKQLTMNVFKPLVITVAIGNYFDDIDENEKDIDGFCADLNGLDHDINNLEKLFAKTLKYEIYPKYDKVPKECWTQKELMDLINEKAKFLNDNKDEYDSLVFAISSHGLKDKIITSDYKTIDKSAINRAFSAQYPSIRSYPRMFIYDACAGGDLRHYRSRIEVMQGSISSVEDIANETIATDIDEIEKKMHEFVTKKKKSKTAESGKAIELTDIHNDNENIWFADEDSPDFRLIECHATMDGFQSFMDNETGSYFIHTFVTNMILNIDAGNKLFLADIFEEIERDLTNKQSIVWRCANGTRYLKFNSVQD